MRVIPKEATTMEATNMEATRASLDMEVIGIPMDTSLTFMVMVEKL
jgi:hypothetical protein